MKTLLSKVGAALLTIVAIAAVIGGCALYERGKALLPEPARAVVDSLDSMGPGGFAGPIAGRASGDATAAPLDACPGYAADAEKLARAARGDLTPESSGGARITALLTVQLDRLESGGTPDALSATGVDVALAQQTDLLAGMATRVRTAALQTPQAQSLAVSLAAALDAVADANETFLAGGTGVRTRSAWATWASRSQGPFQQVDAVSTALGKCP